MMLLAWCRLVAGPIEGTKAYEIFEGLPHLRFISKQLKWQIDAYSESAPLDMCDHSPATL